MAKKCIFYPQNTSTLILLYSCVPKCYFKNLEVVLLAKIRCLSALNLKRRRELHGPEGEENYMVLKEKRTTWSWREEKRTTWSWRRRELHGPEETTISTAINTKKSYSTFHISMKYNIHFLKSIDLKNVRTHFNCISNKKWLSNKKTTTDIL